MELVLFDFDETLILENSLGALFSFHSGIKRLWVHALPALLTPAVTRGVRYAIKKRLYRRCLSGIEPRDLVRLGHHLAKRFTPVQPCVDALHRHVAQGARVWIATAAPQGFVAGVAEALGWPCDRVTGTLLPVQNKVVTGRFTTECSGVEKARRIQKAIAELPDPAQVKVIAAYGNLPADGPLLALAQQGFVVRKGIMQPLQKN